MPAHHPKENTMLDKLAPYAKAIVAIIGATLTAVMVVFPDQPEVQQWGTIILAFLTAVGVYAVPNKQPVPEPAAPEIAADEPEDGAEPVDAA